MTERDRDRDRDGESDWHKALRATARRSHSRSGGAAELQDVFEASLRAEGFTVAREVAVDYPAGSPGRLDLVAKWRDGTTLVIELDNVTPRGRSVLKMKQCPGAVAVSVLRSAAVGWAEGKGWADIVIGLGWRTATRHVANASDDGAFGMTVEAWCAGISDATGRPCTRPTHGQVRQLVEAQQAHRPVTEEPVAWSRKSASEYAAANAGRELSTFGYVRWLDSDKKSGTVLKALPAESPAFAQRRANEASKAESAAREARLIREAQEGAARAAARAGK